MSTMKNKSLAKTNPFLTGAKVATRRVRSLASSTAIETGEPIAHIEQKILHLRGAKHRVSLA